MPTSSSHNKENAMSCIEEGSQATCAEEGAHGTGKVSNSQTLKMETNNSARSHAVCLPAQRCRRRLLLIEPLTPGVSSRGRGGSGIGNNRSEELELPARSLTVVKGKL